jgi:ATPase subunit of ABC transporter with duplicated ATPase domains
LCTLCCQFFWTDDIRYTRRGKTKQKQSRETDNIEYTRGIKTKQKQSRETDNIGYTRRRKTKEKQSRKTDNTAYTRRRKKSEREKERGVAVFRFSIKHISIHSFIRLLNVINHYIFLPVALPF